MKTTAETAFNEIENGMIPEDWQRIKLSEAVQINPKRGLERGTISKKVSMGSLTPFAKKIHHFEVAAFKGGSKFQNGDTLMARITPCLENGKTAFVDILKDGEVGHGSTEFIVLSGKEGRTTNDFVYYLTLSSGLRREAIKSMTGTSGRQRVQADSFGEIEVACPPLQEQRRVARILSDLDSRIELNHQMNKTLEAMAQTIFKHWFVDFEFPDEEGSPYKSSGGEMVYNEGLGKEIAKGWQIKTLNEIADNFDSKRVPLSSRERETRRGVYPYYGATGILDHVNDFIFDGTFVLMGEDGSVVDETGHPILQYVWGKFWVNNHAHVLRGKGISNELLYSFLRNTNVRHIVTGAVQPKINQDNMNKLKFVLPAQEILLRLESVLRSLFGKLRMNFEEIDNLSRLRDSLLPKLMSGRIRVPVEVR